MVTRYAGELVTEPVDWETARRFHGHMGPWFALGMRVGLAGLRDTGAEPHFGVIVTARWHLCPPVSCFLDGLQWSTGATVGKRNLFIEESDRLQVVIENIDDGTKACYTPCQGLESLFHEWVRQLGEREATLRAWEEDGLFSPCADEPFVAH